MANSGFFFIYFRLFKPTLQFLQQINVKKCQSSTWCRDLNSQHLEHESPPITSKPGLRPSYLNVNTIMIPFLSSKAIWLCHDKSLQWAIKPNIRLKRYDIYLKKRPNLRSSRITTGNQFKNDLFHPSYTTRFRVYHRELGIQCTFGRTKWFLVCNQISRSLSHFKLCSIPKHTNASHM